MNKSLKKQDIYIDKHGTSWHYICHEKQCIHICFSPYRPKQGDSHDHRSAFMLHAKILTYLRNFLALSPAQLIRCKNDPKPISPEIESSPFRVLSLLFCILRPAARLEELMPSPVFSSKAPGGRGCGLELKPFTEALFQRLEKSWAGKCFRTFFIRPWLWPMIVCLCVRNTYGEACLFLLLTDQNSPSLQQKKSGMFLIPKAVLEIRGKDIIPNAWFPRLMTCSDGFPLPGRSPP